MRRNDNVSLWSCGVSGVGEEERAWQFIEKNGVVTWALGQRGLFSIVQ